jgi:predicted transcriptional regulator
MTLIDKVKYYELLFFWVNSVLSEKGYKPLSNAYNMISTNTVTGRRTTIFYKKSASRENWSIVNYIGYIKLIQKQKLVK